MLTEENFHFMSQNMNTAHKLHLCKKYKNHSLRWEEEFLKTLFNIVEFCKNLRIYMHPFLQKKIS